jgi:predicted nucleic acid-binding protein
VSEVHSTESLLLLDLKIIRHVPTLFYTEIAQTIWKKVEKRREIPAEEGRQIMQALQRITLNIHQTNPLFDAAFEIALGTGRTVYDSTYLALAEALGCRLVTADERLYNAIKATPLASSVLWVADVPGLFSTVDDTQASENLDAFDVPDLESPWSAQQIEFEFVTGDRTSDEDLAEIADSIDQKLLTLRSLMITDAGLIHLQGLRRLKTLYLNCGRVTDDGLVNLRELTGLTTLNLGSCPQLIAGRVSHSWSDQT